MADRKWWEKPVRVPVITYTDDNPFEAPDIDFDGTNVDEASEGVARVVWQQLQTSRNLNSPLRNSDKRASLACLYGQ